MRRCQLFVRSAIATILAGTLVACGGAAQDNGAVTADSTDETEAVEAEAEDEGGLQKIEFDEPIVLLDNDYATVELIEFYEQEVNWATGPTQVEKCFTLKVTNNMDREFLFSPRGYVNGEEVVCSSTAGNQGPLPSKSKRYSYYAYIDTKPDHTALDSLEDLYTLEGILKFDVYNEDKSYIDSSLSTEFEFSVQTDGPSTDEGTARAGSLSAEEVDAALQGAWKMGEDGKWTFEHGAVSFDSAMPMSGTYEIDAENSMVVVELEATDGTVKAYFPFEYDGSTLTVFKNTDKADTLIKL